MKLPNAEHAVIAEGKLRDYLLNRSHPQNNGKAVILERLGYRADEWQVLANDLRLQHLPEDASEGRPSNYGRNFEVVAELRGPAGRATMRSVWFIDKGVDVPRLITLYPA